MSQLLDGGSDFTSAKSKNHDVPLEHLDFKYVEQCNDVKELEKVYKVLLSGAEGRYVELEHAVETKIRRLAPNSRILRKDIPITDKRGISKSEQANLEAEIEEFVKSIPNLAKEISKNKLNVDEGERTGGDLPPVRNVKEPIVLKTEATKVAPTQAKAPAAAKPVSKKSAKPKDYREWEKIEKQLDDAAEVEVEEEKKIEEEKKPFFAETSVNSEKNKLLKTLPVNVKEDDENVKAIRAEQEKCKGNESFNAKSYDEAVVYYTRSIQLLENAAAYNNRALAFLKLEKWDKVIEDCNSVFQYEKDNVKALLRRSTAYFNKKRFADAKSDIEIVVVKEPLNKKAQELHEAIKKAYKKEQDEQAEVQAKGGKRLTIEETDGEESDTSDEEEQPKPQEVKKSIQIKEVEQDEEDEDEEEDEDQTTVVETIAKTTSEVKTVEIAGNTKVETSVETTRVEVKIEEKPLPQKVVDLKDRANKEYANGQYGEAITYYSKAIDQLVHDFKQEDLMLYYSNTLATLYSNRASSRQRNGEFKDAINDCNKSLDLNGSNTKVLFKKAHLLELSEKYNDSLAEYQKIMRIDPTYKQAQDGYNRVKNLLISRGDLKSGAQQKPVSAPPKPAAKVETVLSFDQLKEKGNEYFKQNNYPEALKFYTKCIETENTNPVAYLNRSICSIKLNDGKGALSDCNFVLKHEPKNVKALYRRALANKILGNLSDAVRDLKEVIAIEPKNAIAHKDLTDIEKLIGTQKGPKIETVSDKKSSQTEKVEPAKASTTKKQQVKVEPKAEPIKKKPVKFENEITNNYEFLQAWNSVSPDDIATYCHLLEKIEAPKLPKYVGSKLDDSMLSTFVKTFHRYIFEETSDEYEHYEDDDGYNLVDRKQKLKKIDIYSYLFQLTKTQRFDIIKMFLDNDLKALLSKCFNYFNENIKESNGAFSKEDIQKLKKLYGL